jgi:hypothetical protein
VELVPLRTMLMSPLTKRALSLVVEAIDTVFPCHLKNA